MHENTHKLEVGHNTAMGSAINKQVDAREHAHPECRKQHRTVSH